MTSSRGERVLTALFSAVTLVVAIVMLARLDGATSFSMRGRTAVRRPVLRTQAARRWLPHQAPALALVMSFVSGNISSL
jgi:hypothetical protein